MKDYVDSISEFQMKLEDYSWKLCDPVSRFSKSAKQLYRQGSLFSDRIDADVAQGDVRVVELFAGVGGFRIGLERASSHFKTIWSNQWEPETKRQDASLIYCKRFGVEGHSNEDINTVPASMVPEHDLLVGGFPCQDYSVATTLKNSGGIQGKKGVLWWEIYRIINESKHKPDYLFFENVDRLLKSPATQRGRDFAIILATLSDLGYCVEWRVINAAEYGMPQRRRRTYIVGYKDSTTLAGKAIDADHFDWVLKSGVIADVFHCNEKGKPSNFTIDGTPEQITKSFNAEEKLRDHSPFGTAGFMHNREVWSADVDAQYTGKQITLGDILVDERDVPEEFFIDDPVAFARWSYLKGAKAEKRTTKEGYEYNYTEGGMAFPDALDKPSRTIITGEGGVAPSRFKHVVLTPSGRYRRLVPIELERLNMFPDNHTLGSSDMRRAFLMGNALVTGIVEGIGRSLINRI